MKLEGFHWPPAPLPQCLVFWSPTFQWGLWPGTCSGHPWRTAWRSCGSKQPYGRSRSLGRTWWHVFRRLAGQSCACRCRPPRPPRCRGRGGAHRAAGPSLTDVGTCTPFFCAITKTDRAMSRPFICRDTAVYLCFHFYPFTPLWNIIYIYI